MKGESFDPADIAASFQKAVVEVLVEVYAGGGRLQYAQICDRRRRCI